MGDSLAGKVPIFYGGKAIQPRLICAKDQLLNDSNGWDINVPKPKDGKCVNDIRRVLAEKPGGVNGSPTIGRGKVNSKSAASEMLAAGRIFDVIAAGTIKSLAQARFATGGRSSTLVLALLLNTSYIKQMPRISMHLFLRPAKRARFSVACTQIAVFVAMPARTGNGICGWADTSGLIAAHLTRRRRLIEAYVPRVFLQLRIPSSQNICRIDPFSVQTVKTFILWIFAHMLIRWRIAHICRQTSDAFRVQFLEDISVSFCSTAATCFKVVPVYTMAISSERVVQSQNSAYLKRLTDAINIPNPPHGILVEWRDIGERPHYRYNFNSMLGLFVTLTRFHFLAQHHILYVHRCWLA
ncbi:hypothetical protein B0H14DRAFT_2582097 [Mycena olivaceomarginata]|nr:hypothetical protein B0H14DRAFT_2582097 [Mycena olivaceomarginata]